MKEFSCDVLVVGGGPAGAFAAVKAAEAGAQVILVDKSYMGKSGCGAFGAGSFKAYLKEEDSLDLWYSKAVEEGYFINDQRWLQRHFETIGDRVKDLESYGVVFEKYENGTYRRIEGQGSSDKRPIKTLMFHGPQFMEAMRKECTKQGVQILDKVMINAQLAHGAAPELAAKATSEKAKCIFIFDVSTGMGGTSEFRPVMEYWWQRQGERIMVHSPCLCGYV